MKIGNRTMGVGPIATGTLHPDCRGMPDLSGPPSRFVSCGNDFVSAAVGLVAGAVALRVNRWAQDESSLIIESGSQLFSAWRKDPQKLAATLVSVYQATREDNLSQKTIDRLWKDYGNATAMRILRLAVPASSASMIGAYRLVTYMMDRHRLGDRSHHVPEVWRRLRETDEPVFAFITTPLTGTIPILSCSHPKSNFPRDRLCRSGTRGSLPPRPLSSTARNT